MAHNRMFTSTEAVLNYLSFTGLRLYTLNDKLLFDPIADTKGHDPNEMIRLSCASTSENSAMTGQGWTQRRMDVFVTRHVFEQLRDSLHDSMSVARRLSTMPIQRAFLYVDVSDFTRERPGRQALIISSLATAVKVRQSWLKIDLCEAIEAQICIGDGFIYVFERALDAACFAAFLAQYIEGMNARGLFACPFHFRMGIHCGPVYCFQDESRKDTWNYVGDGINGGNRVISVIGKDLDDVIFISDAVRNEILALPDEDALQSAVLKSLHNRGRREDKHRQMWRVYELNFADFRTIVGVEFGSIEDIAELHFDYHTDQ